MSEKKNLLVAQSGGPTAAINATLAGVITEAEKSENIEKVMGACYGIQGVLEEKLINLTKKIDTPEKADMLSRTPAAALAQGQNGNVPYLIYLEENIFDMEKFIDDVREM